MRVRAPKVLHNAEVVGGDAQRGFDEPGRNVRLAEEPRRQPMRCGQGFYLEPRAFENAEQNETEIAPRNLGATRSDLIRSHARRAGDQSGKHRASLMRQRRHR
jgi:hypothetical protein